MSLALEIAAAAAIWTVGLAISGLVVRGAAVGGGGDFQWSGAHMLAHGIDPYREALAGHGGEFTGQQLPNYLPLLLELLLPFGVLPFAVARALWLAGNCVMLIAASVLVGKGVGLRSWRLLGFTGLVFSSEPIAPLLGNGQQSALVLLAAVIAYRVGEHRIAGLGLAVMLTKYSFAPVALGHLMRRRWSTLLVATGVEGAALVVFAAATGATVMAGAFGPLRVGQTMARGAGDLMTLTSILTGHRGVASYGAACLGMLVLAWCARHLLARGDWIDALAAGSLIALLTFPHLVYDYVFLLPVVAKGFRLARGPRLLLFGVVGIRWYGWLLGCLNIHSYQLVGVAETMVLLIIAFVCVCSGESIVVAGPSDSLSVP